MPQVPQFLEGLEVPWLGYRKGITEMAKHEARIHKRLRVPKSLCSVCLNLSLDTLAGRADTLTLCPPGIRGRVKTGWS